MHGCQKDTIINEGYTVLNNLPVNRFQCPSLQGCWYDLLWKLIFGEVSQLLSNYGYTTIHWRHNRIILNRILGMHYDVMNRDGWNWYGWPVFIFSVYQPELNWA